MGIGSGSALEVDKVAKFKCSAKNSRPAAIVTWTIGFHALSTFFADFGGMGTHRIQIFKCSHPPSPLIPIKKITEKNNFPDGRQSSELNQTTSVSTTTSEDLINVDDELTLYPRVTKHFI